MMFRLVALLCVAMVLTLMIGGQDRGQARLGLSLPPLMPPIVERARPAEVRAASVAALVPVAAPAPAAPPPETQAIVEAPATSEVAATAPPPARPTFTLSTVEEADIAALAVAPAPAVTTVLYVAATSVNVRQGPSTQDPVLGRLTRNEAVSLVRDAGDGWMQVRIEGDGIEGYVAARLLTDRAPAP